MKKRKEEGKKNLVKVLVMREDDMSSHIPNESL